MARSHKRRGGHEEAHNDERWLLTYADMITLLMALFMVLFSISSVNVSKFQSLQNSLKNAFDGRPLPGGVSIANAGGSDRAKSVMPTPPNLSIQPQAGGRGSKNLAKTEANAEAEDFRRVKAEVDKLAAQQGLASRIHTSIEKQGLDIRILSDDLLFASGSAVPEQRSWRLLAGLGVILRREATHPVDVYGYTDSAPISTAQFPSNWELSGARASAVVRAFIGASVQPQRLTAVGRAYLDPLAPNATPAGRQLNRRVEVLLPRLYTSPAAPSSTSSTH